MKKLKTSAVAPLSPIFLTAILITSLVPFVAFGNREIAALVAVSSGLAILFVFALLYFQIHNSDLLLQLAKSKSFRRSQAIKTR